VCRGGLRVVWACMCMYDGRGCDAWRCLVFAVGGWACSGAVLQGAAAAAAAVLACDLSRRVHHHTALKQNSPLGCGSGRGQRGEQGDKQVEEG